MLPSMPGLSARVALLGGALAAAALAMMGGWAFEIEPIVKVFPGFLMVFNTALGFFVAGVMLAAGALVPARRRMARRFAGFALVTLGALVLVEYALGIDLRIDQPGMHAWLADASRNPHPGRSSPTTSTTFVIAGAVFLLCVRATTLAQAFTVRLLTFAIALSGTLALAGDLLKLFELVDSYFLTQVSLPTAIGFVVLATGLCLSWQDEPWAGKRLIRGEDDRIALAGAAILAASIAIAGVAIFGLMKASVERMLVANLAYTLKVRQATIVDAIERGIRETSAIGHRPTIRRLYLSIRDRPQDPLRDAYFLTVAESLLREEFSAFAFYNAEGREIARAGAFIQASRLRMPLAHGTTPVEIQWDGGFMLRTRADVIEEGRRIGELRGQIRLTELDAAVSDISALGETGEFALCMRFETTLQCGPTRLEPRPFDVPILAGQRLPMSYALEGETGVRKLTDYRGKGVLAAYAPLGTYGVATVLKTDLDELYLPIRNRLAYIALILLLVSAGGGWLLRNRVRPLARGLLRSKEQLRMALDGSQLALWDWDIASGELHLDEQWARLLGDAPHPIDTSFKVQLDLVHPDDLERVRTSVVALLRGTTSHYDIEHRVRTSNGQWKWIRSRGRVCERTPGGRALRAIGTNVDISERKQQLMRADHRANHDALTGLPNRSLFADRLERAIAQGRRDGGLFALMYIDVDRFKSVNDSQGHAAGDAVLEEFACRLSSSVRAVDTVARLGGDEFAVILEGLTTREDGTSVANKIVLAMRPPFRTGETSTVLSASVGIAFHEGKEVLVAKDLIDAADQALYQAKTAGRDGWRAAA